MKRYSLIPTLALALVTGACAGADPVAPSDATIPDELLVTAAMTSQSAACWGQASAVFAQTGEMGLHASQESTPRAGLRNLARALYDAGIIPDDSMTALGAFVASELGLSIDACDT